MIILGSVQCGHMGYSPGASGDVWMSGANSAGGVSVRITFQNDTQKTIKYVYFDVVPYNAVKDAQRCTISGKTKAELSFTGPIEPGAVCRNIYWENIWYNRTITTLDLVMVEVLYMDGSSEKLTGATSAPPSYTKPYPDTRSESALRTANSVRPSASRPRYTPPGRKPLPSNRASRQEKNTGNTRDKSDSFIRNILIDDKKKHAGRRGCVSPSLRMCSIITYII